MNSLYKAVLLIAIAGCSSTHTAPGVKTVVTDSSKSYAGNVFSGRSSNVIEILFSSNGSPVKLHFYQDEKLVREDSILITAYYKDTLMDINADGINEFIVYTTDAGKYKNYGLTCYYLDTLRQTINMNSAFDSLYNVRFFKGFLTSLVNFPEQKIARRYNWSWPHRFSLQEEIIINHTNKADSCDMEKYSFHERRSTRILKTTACGLDTIYGLP